MRTKKDARKITQKLIAPYNCYLVEQEKSEATIEKYMRDLLAFFHHFEGKVLDKMDLLEWKTLLLDKYAPASVNSMLAAINGLMDYLNWSDLKVKPLKLQKAMFSDSKKELSKEEYLRLVRTAKTKGNEKLSLIIQTICSTGIRVSELKFITVEAVQAGKVEINNKGKLRTIFLPQQLRSILRKYLSKQKRTSGMIFVTRTGKPVNRSNIWRYMKALWKSADVSASKVFPHNLRHLFARIYYTLEKDLSRLADILGHSNVNTTRIYTMESGIVHAKQMERMGLIIT